MQITKNTSTFFGNNFVIDCKEKAKIFNEFFASQCVPFQNDSVLPNFFPLTDSTIDDIVITDEDIRDLLLNLNVNKATGPDNISANMLKTCGDHLILPLKIIFKNLLITGSFPTQWKKANVTPAHKKMISKIH